MTTVVLVQQGGTGSNNASDARLALGVAPSVAYDQANSAHNQANAAFAAANTGTGSSNAAYGQANSAYAQANLAYGQANTVYGQANLAYNAANTAQNTAQNAYDRANSAYVQANASYSQSNLSYSQANAAFGQANLSYGQANAAFGQANLAYGQANAAYGQANLAYAAANASNLLSGGLISGTLNVTQDIIVGGNIYLGGNTTFINVSTYQVDDPLILLAANNTLTDSVDIGIIGGKNTSGTFSHTGFARDATDAKWKLFDNLPDNAHQNNIINFANATIATLVANIESNSILLSGNLVATNVQLNAVYNQANASYSQANLAYNAANGANGQATAAYNQANSAYGQANSVYSQANLSYNQANSAYNAANSAFGQSNLAYAQANSAFGQANLAYAAANNAANTVRVSQNNGSILSGTQLNFVNTSTVTVSVTDSGNGNANIAFTSAGGSGTLSNIAISSNGTFTTNANAFNFVNTSTVSVTVSQGVNGNANISFTSVGGSVGLSNTIIKTTSYTAVNGDANLTYTLPITPLGEAYLFVIKNGVVLTPTTDYSVANTTLTVKETGQANDIIEVRYFEQVTVYESPNTQIAVTSNTVAAQTNTFTVANVTAINRLQVTKNGLQLVPNLHFTLNTSSNTVTLNAVAEVGDILTFTNFRNVTDIVSGGLTQYSYNTTTSSIETVDEWSKSTYRSAKYQMQVENGAGYYSTDIMLIHDGISTNLVQYGTTSFASNVGVFTSDISGSNVRLRFTATDATSYLTYYKTILANRASESLPTDLMNGSDSYDLMITLPFHPTDLN